MNREPLDAAERERLEDLIAEHLARDPAPGSAGFAELCRQHPGLAPVLSRAGIALRTAASVLPSSRATSSWDNPTSRCRMIACRWSSVRASNAVSSRAMSSPRMAAPLGDNV
jgi:hypothetical protein